MTDLEERTWLLEVEDAPADMWSEIVFRDGIVMDGGKPVGSYSIEGDHLGASFGEQCILSIELRPGPSGSHAGTMTTFYNVDEAEDLHEVITLIPAASK